MRNLASPWSTDLSEREKLAVDFAYRFGTNHLSVTSEDIERLRQHFTDEEVVELGMLAAQFLGFGRLVKVFGMELGMTCALLPREDAPAEPVAAG